MVSSKDKVQQFLFKGKKKKSFTREFDVQDLENLLDEYAEEYHQDKLNQQKEKPLCTECWGEGFTNGAIGYKKCTKGCE